MEDRIREEELAHLEYIKSKLLQQLNQDTLVLENQKVELLEQRKRMWEEGAHGVADFDDIINMASYDEMVREEHGHYIRRGQQVKRITFLLDNPYFGRIDFKENEGDEIAIYIGRYCFCDSNHHYEIYDWRSPIASMFYESAMGETGYNCPQGRIQGTLLNKRQFRIQKGSLMYVFEADQVVQDEMLGQVLSENTDVNLKIIIDTITNEQNQAIRGNSNTNMLIQGPAGSGKTSVGMHRLAYLLYKERDSLTADKIVVLSKNEIFSSYVSHILPELGEEEAAGIIFDDLIHFGLPRKYHYKWYFEEVEYLLEHEETSVRTNGIALKGSFPFLEFLKEIIPHIKKQKKELDPIKLYLLLLQKYLRKQGMMDTIYYHTKRNLEQMTINYEDIVALQVIRILEHETTVHDNVKLVVVDEAQDYSPMQLFLIRTFYPKAQFTILMDPNQIIHSAISTVDIDTFRNLFGIGLEEMVLHKSYRCSAPINALSFHLLGIHDDKLYIHRQGIKPVCFETTEDIKTITQLLLKPHMEEKLIGILVPDRETARQETYSMKQELKTKAGREIQCITSPEEVMSGRIIMMPMSLAKGLEFDVVIVLDPNRRLQNHINLLYLMCTRALHELYFIVPPDGCPVLTKHNPYLDIQRM